MGKPSLQQAFLCSFILFSASACMLDSNATDTERSDKKTTKSLLADFTGFDRIYSTTNICETRDTEVTFANLDISMSFEYYVCDQENILRQTFNFSTVPFVKGIVEPVLDDWSVIYMKNQYQLISGAEGIYFSEALHIRPNVSLESFRAYVATLPTHCELSETVLTPNEEVFERQFAQRPRVLEIINSDWRDIEELSERFSEAELKQYRTQIRKINLHNNSCGPSNHHLWENGYLIYLPEDELVKEETIKIFR